MNIIHDRCLPICTFWNVGVIASLLLSNHNAGLRNMCSVLIGQCSRTHVALSIETSNGKDGKEEGWKAGRSKFVGIVLHNRFCGTKK
jgi:hypothetical protein